MIKFCEIVGMHAKTKQKVMEYEFIKQRREALKAGDEKTYREIV